MKEKKVFVLTVLPRPVSVDRSVGFVFGRCVDDAPRARPKPGWVGGSLHWIGLDAKSVREKTEIKKAVGSGVDVR